MPISAALSAIRRNILPLAACVAAFAVPAAKAQEWAKVTDGKSGAGLYLHASGKVEYSDSGVFKTSGNGGYLATIKEYSHYRTRIEWNNNTGGNTGFLYHVNIDRVWPIGLECQMASNDVGSLWTTGARFDSRGSGDTFSETGGPITGFGTTGTSRKRFIRSQDPGASDGQWNTWEMYVKGDSLEIKANGKLVMRIGKLTIKNGTPLVRGKIGLQIEGATVQWRNWEIQDLAPARP
jgi:hypothetical protein